MRQMRSIICRRTEVENQALEKENEKKKKSSFWGKFLGIVLLTVLVAAGLFLLWVWISYRMRFSAEVIRVGIMALYIIPCLLGGRLIRRCRASGAVFWGIALGACYFGVILAISLGMRGGKLDMNSVGIAIPLMCVLSSVTGTIRLKNAKR